MLPPLFQPFLRLVATQPELLGDHAQAYAELVASELGGAGSRIKRQLLLAAMAACGIGVGAVLTGVALMLWAVVPLAQATASWALIVVPLPPFLLALGCLLAARRQNQERVFSNLRRQFAADLAMMSPTTSP